MIWLLRLFVHVLSSIFTFIIASVGISGGGGLDDALTGVVRSDGGERWDGWKQAHPLSLSDRERSTRGQPLARSDSNVSSRRIVRSPSRDSRWYVSVCSSRDKVARSGSCRTNGRCRVCWAKFGRSNSKRIQSWYRVSAPLWDRRLASARDVNGWLECSMVPTYRLIFVFDLVAGSQSLFYFNVSSASGSPSHGHTYEGRTFHPLWVILERVDEIINRTWTRRSESPTPAHQHHYLIIRNFFSPSSCFSFLRCALRLAAAVKQSRGWTGSLPRRKPDAEGVRGWSKDEAP